MGKLHRQKRFAGTWKDSGTVIWYENTKKNTIEKNLQKTAKYVKIAIAIQNKR